MNAVLPSSRPPAFVAVLALLCTALAGHLAAAPFQPPVLKPATNGSRFLFVLDMSSAMKSSDAATRQGVFDLIFTGFDGQMRHGDSVGLWLFTDEVKAGEFPLQIWDSENPLDAASHAAQYIRAQKYGGKARLDEALPKMLQLSRVVRDVHLVLFSTGEQPMHGTPFDASINEAYASKQAERKKHDKPLITTLNVQGGKIVSASVTLPGQFIQLPERPAPPVAVAPAAATNKVSQAAPPTPPSVPPAASDPSHPIVTMSVEPGPPTKIWKPIPAPTNTGPGARIIEITTHSNTLAALSNAPATPTTLAATNPTAAPALDPAVDPASSAATATPPPPVPPVQPATPELATAPIATPILPPTTDPMPVNAREATEPAPAVTPVTTTGAIVVLEPVVSPIVLLAVGAALFAACLALLIIVLRRLRPPTQGSFITQSMHRR